MINKKGKAQSWEEVAEGSDGLTEGWTDFSDLGAERRRTSEGVNVAGGGCWGQKSVPLTETACAKALRQEGTRMRKEQTAQGTVSETEVGQAAAGSLSTALVYVSHSAHGSLSAQHTCCLELHAYPFLSLPLLWVSSLFSHLQMFSPSSESPPGKGPA